MDTLESAVARHPFLKGMSAPMLKTLADAAMNTRFEAGETIFNEGDPANRFYLIEEGEVVLEARAPKGAATQIQTLGAGDVLGWSWLFPPYFWNFTARAAAPTSAIFIYGSRLREKCDEDHDLGYELMKRMSAIMLQRLQSARRRLTAAAG